MIVLLVILAAVIGSVDSNISFRISFGVLLLTLSGAQLKVSIDLYKHRNDLLLQLFQPVSLSLFVAASAVATIAALLFAFPEYDATCALRQPIILTSVTFMGNLLIGRAWRIGSILSSTAAFAASGDDIDAVGMARLRVMNVLSKVSQLGRYVGSCGKTKLRVNTGIRKAITFADSIFVALILLLPQLVLQIVNLSVPSVRMVSVEILEVQGLYYTCESRADPYVLIVGIVLTAIPFGISLLINVVSKGIPDKFREFDDIIRSMASSFWVLLATLPTVGMIGQAQTNAHAYLIAASLLSFLLPLSYNIGWPKLNNALMSTSLGRVGTNNNKKKPTERMSSDISSLSHDGKAQDDPQILAGAEDTAVMAQMFETMGSTTKALAMNRDILTLFKFGERGNFSWESGFTLSEVNSFGPKTLEIVVKTLRQSAKLWQDIYFSNNDDEAKCSCIKCIVDALDIFDIAPAKRLLRDRGVIFPCYSLLNAIAKITSYSPPNNMPREDFELSLAKNFVKETRHQLYHQCRALAYQADVLRRHGNHEDALLVVGEMNSIYEPQLHSRAIMKEYVSDHCIDMLAASTYWLYHLGRNNEALQLCDKVIETMLPEIEATELVSKFHILFPICRTLTSNGGCSNAEKAFQLFRTHVADPAESAGDNLHPVVKLSWPIMVIFLKCCMSICDGDVYSNSDADMAYMLNREDNPAWFETGFLSVFDAAWSTTCAATCLLLAKIACHNSHDKSSALINEGLKCLKVSANTLEKEDGTIVNRIAHSYYSQILAEMESFSVPYLYRTS